MNKSIDETIKKQVIDHLYWDSRVDASEIQIKVEDQVVELRGSVPSYTESEAALFDAWSIPQVAGVKNQLFIKYPSAVDVPSDSEVKSIIQKQLEWSRSISEDDIDIMVDKGVVTLEGAVNAYWKKFRIEQISSDVKGVMQINNKISVVPTKSIVDEAIADDISKAFDRSRIVDLNKIDVRVEDGKVTLSGKGLNPIGRIQAMEIASNTIGVTDVIDRLSLA